MRGVVSSAVCCSLTVCVACRERVEIKCWQMFLCRTDVLHCRVIACGMKDLLNQSVREGLSSKLCTGWSAPPMTDSSLQPVAEPAFPISSALITTEWQKIIFILLHRNSASLGNGAGSSPSCIHPLCWFSCSACCRCGRPGTCSPWLHKHPAPGQTLSAAQRLSLKLLIDSSNLGNRTSLLGSGSRSLSLLDDFSQTVPK